MKNQLLIIIKNNLETFSPFFEEVKKSGYTNTHIIDCEELLTGWLNDELSRLRTFEILIAIDKEFFRDVEVKIREFFQSINITPFTNFLLFYRKREDLEVYFKKNNSGSSFFLTGETDKKKHILYLQSYINEMFIKSTISYRLSDYIYHSFKGVVYSEILKMKKQEIERLNKELERRNRIDPLTNLFNRTALYEFLDRERNRTVRNLFKMGAKQLQGQNKHFEPLKDNKSFSLEFVRGNFIIFAVMMIDLDRFKLINDTYGHLIGDTVLRTVGSVFKKEGILREQDVVGRFGGEEFIIILPGSNAAKALGPAQRLAAELKSHTFKGNDGTDFNVTMSVGISEYHPFDKDNEEIIQRADKALYYAKQNGRDQTVIYEDTLGH